MRKQKVRARALPFTCRAARTACSEQGADSTELLWHIIVYYCIILYILVYCSIIHFGLTRSTARRFLARKSSVFLLNQANEIHHRNLGTEYRVGSHFNR